MPPRNPSFLGTRSFPGVGLPQIPAALEAAAVVAAVMGFGLAWAWLAAPSPRAVPVQPAYAVVAMSSEWSNDPAALAASTTAPQAAAEEWLVDGFNLLHTVLLGGEERSRWWTASNRTRVLEAVAGATHERQHPHVWVVFDGSRPAPQSEPGRLHSVFAPSADDWLLRRVRHSTHPERIVVVTADRRLAARARHHGATVQTPGRFLAGEA